MGNSAMANVMVPDMVLAAPFALSSNQRLYSINSGINGAFTRFTERFMEQVRKGLRFFGALRRRGVDLGGVGQAVTRSDRAWCTHSE